MLSIQIIYLPLLVPSVVFYINWVYMFFSACGVAKSKYSKIEFGRNTSFYGTLKLDNTINQTDTINEIASTVNSDVSCLETRTVSAVIWELKNLKKRETGTSLDDIYKPTCYGFHCRRFCYYKM
jgi:hypothetical protein